MSEKVSCKSQWEITINGKTIGFNLEFQNSTFAYAHELLNRAEKKAREFAKTGKAKDDSGRKNIKAT